jgi:hypothetical protein
MNISQSAIVREILRAITLVIVGTAIITAVATSLHPAAPPYYAMIASTRTETQVELKKQMGETVNVANSGTGSK